MSKPIAPSAGSTSTTASASTATVAPKRKAVRPPPVVDRAGVTLGSSPVVDATTMAMPTPGTAPPTPTPPATPANATQSAGQTTALATTTAAPITTTTSTPGATTGTVAVTPVAIDPSTVPTMTPAPTVSVPVPPAGFVPVPASTLSGYRPMQSELASVSDAVYELASFSGWSSVFGITAPAASSIGGRLSVAAGWTSLLAQSNSWTSYVKSQEGMAWKDALEVMESLKPAFQLAVAASPSIANQYPALTRLLGAQKVVAKRAVSTKKKNAAAASAAASTAAVTTVPAAIAPAGSGLAAPARTVTVTG